MVPAARLRALGGMRSDGTASRELFETDPGRLELLGVRWVQVPTDTLAVPGDADGLGEPLDVVLEPPRPHLFALPITRATEVRLLSFLAGAVDVEDGDIVAECVARLASGREIWLPIRAGVDTAEWAWDRPDLARPGPSRPAESRTRPSPRARACAATSTSLRCGCRARFAVRSLRFRAVPGAPPLRLVRAGLYDAEASRATGLSTAAAFVSDEVRLAEAAGTPLVSLFEVRRGIGPAWVVESLRLLPDAQRVLDVLRAADPARRRHATRGDCRGGRRARRRAAPGQPLPGGGRRAGRGGAHRSAGSGTRAAGDRRGLRPRVPGPRRGFEARVLRVNADRIGVVLQEGTHRVVLTHRARGLRGGRR